MAEVIENTNDWWDNLSEEQKLQNAESGQTISSEEFWDRLKN